MKRIALLFLSLVFFCNFITYAQPEIKAKSAILASAEGAQIIFEKNPDQKVYPAGLTKLFTALVAYNICGTEQIVTIPQNIGDYLAPLEPSMKLKPSEQITSGNLISAMIVGSANDASIALAIHCSGTIDDFVNKMNEKAKELNLSSTNFVNPTGNHDENQYTTASDMLKIYSEIYKIKPLINILNSKNITILPTNLSPKRTFWTGNHLISRYIETKYIYPSAIGGKTSASSAGGYSIATHGKRGGIELIAIVFSSELDAGVDYSFVDAKSMFEYGYNNYTLKNIVKQDELICETKVKSALNSEHLLLYAGSSLKSLIMRDDNTQSVQKNVNISSSITPPIKKGDVIGSVDYTYQGKLIGNIELIAGSDVRLNIIKYIGNSILWVFNLTIVKILISIIIAALFFYIMLVYLAFKKQKKTKKRK